MVHTQVPGENSWHSIDSHFMLCSQSLHGSIDNVDMHLTVLITSQFNFQSSYGPLGMYIQLIIILHCIIVNLSSLDGLLQLA